jgi:hypothetical protein
VAVLSVCLCDEGLCGDDVSSDMKLNVVFGTLQGYVFIQHQPLAKHMFFNTLSPEVTMCTTKFDIHNSTFCPHRVFVCLVWI